MKYRLQVGVPPSRHCLSKSMILSTKLTSAYLRRCDSLIRSGLPPFSADGAVVQRCERAFNIFTTTFLGIQGRCLSQLQ